MLNRRHLRIRVLQFVYSCNRTKDMDISKVEKEFLKSLDKVEELYIYLLLFIVELSDYAENFQENAKSKRMPSEEDLNPNTKFTDNLYIDKLKEESNLIELANHKKLSFANQKSILRSTYLRLKESPLFLEYISLNTTDFEDDKKFVLKLFSKYIIDSEEFQYFLNEQNIFWDDDLPFISSMVAKTIKDSTSQQISLFNLFKNKEDKQFAIDLLRHSIIHHDEFSEMIANKTTNWEIERVAQMDLILMHMTLAELLKMPHVPVKVSINEYVDLAKYYSTPNSKNFINGILDSILIDLKQKGLIKKIGRGLIE